MYFYFIFNLFLKVVPVTHNNNIFFILMVNKTKCLYSVSQIFPILEWYSGNMFYLIKKLMYIKN